MARETPQKRGIIDKIGDAIDTARGLNVSGAEAGRRAKEKARKRTYKSYVEKAVKGGTKPPGMVAPTAADIDSMIRGG